MRGSLLRVWAVAAGVAAGAVAAHDGSPGAGVATALVTVGALGCVLRRRPVLVVGALLLFGVGAGGLAASVRAEPDPALAAVARTIPFCELRGRVLESLGGSQLLLSVDEAACGDRALTGAGAVAAEMRAPAGSPYVAEGWLVPLGDEGFDSYRRHAGALAELVPRDAEFASPGGAFRVAALVRNGLRDAAGALPTDEGGLVRGLTIGDTDQIAPQTLEDFRRSGLSHLLAVSGSNVALVLVGAGWLCRRLPFKVRLAAGAGAVMLFVLIVGPDASVLRAAAMGSIALFALGMGRQAEPLHALGLAVAVVIVARPQIVFSVGLHLSVAATAGIVLWTPRLVTALRRLPSPVRLPLAVTASAQFAVLPLLVAAFEEASVVAPVANLLATAAVVPATALGLVGGLVAVALPGLGGLILGAARPFASWILMVGELCAEPSWAGVRAASWTGWLAAIPVVAAAAWTLRSHGRPITLPP